MALLDRVREALEERVASLGPRDGLPLVVAHWLDVATDGDPRAVALAAAGHEGPMRTHRDVATLGVAVAGGLGFRDEFLRGVEWLRSRRFHVPGQSPTLEADGLAVFALAVGMSAVGSRDQDWLVELTRRASAFDPWEQGLMATARRLMNGENSPMPLDLAAALASKGLPVLERDDELAARQFVMTMEDVPPERAVVRTAAIRWLLRQEATVSLTRPAFDQLVALLEKFEHALKRWPWEAKKRTPKSTPQKWDLQNEYHVQAVLWTVLAPVFPDLVDEEYLRKIGPKQPRADLGIPSLRTIIEVKYMREGTFAKMIDEVAADTGLYLSGDTGYDRIIAFVWDDSGSSHRHEELRKGLLMLDGVEAAIVVARPGTWTRASGRGDSD